MDNDITIVRKISDLIKSIKRTSTKRIGKPEPLRYEFKGCWSRRINLKHRLVYKITGKRGVDQKCTILQCIYHLLILKFKLQKPNSQFNSIDNKDLLTAHFFFILNCKNIHPVTQVFKGI